MIITINGQDMAVSEVAITNAQLTTSPSRLMVVPLRGDGTLHTQDGTTPLVISDLRRQSVWVATHHQRDFAHYGGQQMRWDGAELWIDDLPIPGATAFHVVYHDMGTDLQMLAAAGIPIANLWGHRAGSMQFAHPGPMLATEMLISIPDHPHAAAVLLTPATSSTCHVGLTWHDPTTAVQVRSWLPGHTAPATLVAVVQSMLDAADWNQPARVAHARNVTLMTILGLPAAWDACDRIRLGIQRGRFTTTGLHLIRDLAPLLLTQPRSISPTEVCLQQARDLLARGE